MYRILKLGSVKKHPQIVEDIKKYDFYIAKENGSKKSGILELKKIIKVGENGVYNKKELKALSKILKQLAKE